MFWLIIIYIIHIYFFIQFLDYYYDIVLLFLFEMCYPILHALAILFAFLLKQKKEFKMLLVLALIIISTFLAFGTLSALSWISKEAMIEKPPLLSSAVCIVILSVVFIRRGVEYMNDRKKRLELLQDTETL